MTTHRCESDCHNLGAEASSPEGDMAQEWAVLHLDGSVVTYPTRDLAEADAAIACRNTKVVSRVVSPWQERRERE